MLRPVSVLRIVCVLVDCCCTSAKNMSIKDVQEYVDYYQETRGKLRHRVTIATWNFMTNVTDENFAVQVSYNPGRF
jgi:hypothetical protein